MAKAVKAKPKKVKVAEQPTEVAKPDMLPKIAALENLLTAAGQVTPEVEAALKDLKESV